MSTQGMAPFATVLEGVRSPGVDAWDHHRVDHACLAPDVAQADVMFDRVADKRTSKPIVLDRHGVVDTDFLRLFAAEKRRAERSRLPLSLVVYRASTDAPEPYAADRFLDLLHRTKRETDFLGRVSPGTVAMICPYTDAAGMEAYVRKVAALAEDGTFEAATGTYPDARFDALAETVSRLSTPDLPVIDDKVGHYAFKRAVDIIGALIAIVLFAPVMAVVAAAVKLTSRGPVIFRQTRLGRGGTPFTFYKFRSMVSDGDDRIHRDFISDLIRGRGTDSASQRTIDAPQFKLRSDPRVTPVGMLIRKTSLDELPQLFNVLGGSMSLVGPRPPISYEADHYECWHLRRILTAKPGITGLWQVQGRSRVTFDEMVRMDLRYIKACSFSLDMAILARTIMAVVRGTGAS